MLHVDEQIYLVVSNDEEQHSIWSAERDMPAGWSAEGFSGTKSECLDHIADVWSDIRPLSLRQKLEHHAEGREDIDCQQ